MAWRWMIGLVLSLAMWALGAMLIVGALGERLEAIDSRRWPAVAGRIEAATIEPFTMQRRWAEPVQMYRPRVVYTYHVDGHRYRGDRIGLDEATSRSRAVASAALAPYPPGAAVTVSYDPERPERALLERGLPWDQTLVPLAGGLLLVAVGGLLVWLVRLSPFRYRRRS